MFGGLRFRVLALLSALMVLTIVLVTLGVLRLTQRNMELLAERHASQATELAATTMSAALDPRADMVAAQNMDDLQAVCELFVAQVEGTRIAVLTDSGDRLAGWPAAFEPESASHGELAREGGEGLTRVTGTGRTRHVEVLRPLELDGVPVAVVHVVWPLDDVTTLIATTQRLTVLYVALDALLVLVLGYLMMTRSVVNPIRAISRAAERVAEGDLRSRVQSYPANEVGQLARSFNRMVERLESMQASLTTRVEEVGRARDALESANVELERAQDEIIRSEKLATIGQLAAGLAHEIGNPLTALMGLVDLLRDPELLDEEERQDTTTRIEGELQRIHETIRELLAFARTKEDELGEAHLGRSIEAAAGLFAHHGRARGVKFSHRAQDVEVLVPMRETRLVQVLLNLLINAADGTDGSGTVTLSSELLERNERPEVRIRIDDDGHGIAPEIRAQVFEPFFTTKDPGTGTGLGLATCERLVTNAGGQIILGDSDLGGARVDVWLPYRQPTGAASDR